MEKPQFIFVAGVSLVMHAAVAAALAPAMFFPGPGFDFGLAFVIFLYMIAWGFVPVIFYGAVAYTLMAQTGFAKWHYVLIVGMAPGLAVVPFHRLFGLVVIGYGVAVALLTHVI